MAVATTINMLREQHTQSSSTRVISFANEAGIECETLVLFSGAPYAAVIETAKRNACDLIYMASHSRHGVNASMLGSETEDTYMIQNSCFGLPLSHIWNF